MVFFASFIVVSIPFFFLWEYLRISMVGRDKSGRARAIFKFRDTIWQTTNGKGHKNQRFKPTKILQTKSQKGTWTKIKNNFVEKDYVYNPFAMSKTLQVHDVTHELLFVKKDDDKTRQNEPNWRGKKYNPV